MALDKDDRAPSGCHVPGHCRDHRLVVCEGGSGRGDQSGESEACRLVGYECCGGGVTTSAIPKSVCRGDSGRWWGTVAGVAGPVVASMLADPSGWE